MNVCLKENKILKISFIKLIISKFLVWTLIYLAAQQINYSFLDIFNIFDGEHYLNIAMNGYSEEALFAFFPLVPMVIRFLSLFGGETIAVILFVILMLFLSCLNILYIYKLGKNLGYSDERISTIETIYIFSPIMVWNTLVYTETIQVFLTLVSFNILFSKNEEKIKDYIALGICIGLNVCTKSTGAVFFFAIFIKMFYDFIKKNEKFINVFVTYSIATVLSILYPAYLFIIGVGPFKFVDIQYTHWNRIKSFPFQVLYYDIKSLVNVFTADYFMVNLILFIINWSIILVFLIAIIKAIIKKNSNILLIFTCIAFLLVMMGTVRYNNINLPSISFYRYVLSNILFLFLLDIKNKNIKEFITIFFGFLGLFITILVMYQLPFC